MFESIIQVIVNIIVLIITIKFGIKVYNKIENPFLEVLFIMLLGSVLFVIVIFFLDRYNIPTRIGYTKNINSSDWVSILTNYFGVIISTLLNALFLIYATSKQIKETYKDNLKLNNENQRIQNLPLLQYNFTNEKLEEFFGEHQKWIFSNQDDSNIDSIDFTMEIDNIGLNAVRKVYLEVESELFNKKENFELCNQSNIKNNEKKKKEIIITNVAKGTYKIEISVYYQDLLKNWYKQKVHLTISVINIYDSKTRDRNQINFIVVDDEEMLSGEPDFIKKMN